MKLKPILLSCILGLCCLDISAQNQIYMAENGNDSNSGTKDSPVATLIGARDRARATGAKTIWVRGGRYGYDKSCDLDGKDSGLKISGYEGEKAIFDGAKYLKAEDFKKVTAAETLQRLHKDASGKVFEISIEETELVDLLKENTVQLSMGDRMIHASRYPNTGYVHINDGTISNADEKVNKKGTDSQAKGGTFKLYESFDAAKWNAEIQRSKRAEVIGYYSADWLKETSRIFSLTGSEIHLMNGSRYGLKDRGRPNRLYVKYLLCELDQPGEWYYDALDKKLYLWPTAPITKDSKIGIWAGSELINITNTKGIKIQKLTIQHISKGKSGGDAAIDMRSSESCEIAGVTFRYISNIAVANIIDGKNCGIKSCDIFDCEGGFRCYGGTVSRDLITYGRNYIENCHYTQIFSKDFYGKMAALKGAGNVFRNNLIHNTNGQPFTYSGVDHTIELNEAFNTGIEEGDGGVFYTGNSIWAFGTEIKHNFIHHNMSVPGLLGKGAIHCDDFDAGKKIVENVFYKAGWAGVKMNKGGGHTVKNNVFIDGYLGIRNNTYRQSFYETSADFLKNDPENKSKPNYIGRMLQAIGKPGWQNGLTESNWASRVSDYWSERYPSMAILFKKYQDNKKMHAYESRYYDNLFHNNSKGTIASFTRDDARRGNKEVALNIFESPSNLNFKFKNRPSGFPKIPFDKIGLYKDGFRCAVPNKNEYRSRVKRQFASRPSHDGRARYNRASVNTLLYYNTGEMVLGLMPCYNSSITEGVAEFKYDLGTLSSTAFEDYKVMSDQSRPSVYEWTEASELKAVNRNTLTSVNALNRDFLSATLTNTLAHHLDNGTWNVVITLGDTEKALDKIRVTAEGEVMEKDISRDKGEFKNLNFTTSITDGELNLTFADDGGSTRGWSVSRIWLRRLPDAPSAPQVLADGLYRLKSPFLDESLLSRPPENFNALMVNTEEYADQQWFFEHQGGNVYTIKNRANNRYLEVPNAKCGNGENVATWTNAIGSHKRWLVEANGSYFALKPEHCGQMALDRATGATGANATLWTYNSSNNNQKWEVIPVNSGAVRWGRKETEKVLQFYPNPTQGILEIRGAEIGDIIRLFNTTGQQVYELTIKDSEVDECDISGLRSGLYQIKIGDRPGQLLMKD